MRPGPGLVVMALAFISGARRGSTSTSSKISSSLPTSSSSSTSSAFTSSPSSFSSSSPSSYSPSSTSTPEETQPSSVSILFPSFLGGGGVLTPTDSPTTQQRERTNAHPTNDYNHFYHNNYPPLSFVLPEHLWRPNYDSRGATRSELISSSTSLRTSKEIRRSRSISAGTADDRTSDIVGRAGGGGGGGGGVDSSDGSHSVNLDGDVDVDVDTNDNSANAAVEGLLVRFPSHSADSSTSLDEDDILALVAEDDLLSEESFDRLTQLTEDEDKIGYINEDDYSGTEGVSSSSAGSESSFSESENPQQQQQEQQPQQQQQDESGHIVVDSDSGVVGAGGAGGGETVYAANLVTNNDIAALADNAQTSESGKSFSQTAEAESKRTVLRRSSIFESVAPLTRLNPWISACDLAQPGTAPDLQGQCSAGTLPVARVNEGPGPPTCPKSCEQLRLNNKENIINFNIKTNDNNIKYLMNTNPINLKSNHNNKIIMTKVRRDVSDNRNAKAVGSAERTTPITGGAAAASAATAVKTTTAPATSSTTTTTTSASKTTMTTSSTTTAASLATYEHEAEMQQDGISIGVGVGVSVVNRQSQNNNDIVKMSANHGGSFNNLNFINNELKYNHLRQDQSSNSNSNNKQHRPHNSSDDDDVEQQQEQQQCLDYLGDTDESSPAHLCSLKSPSDLMAHLRHLRLKHCCERNVLSALHTVALNATLSGGIECVHVLTDVMDLDSLATRITCEVAEILFRFDCRQVYSLIHQCDDCKEAYRRWVCSTLVPYFAEQGDVIATPGSSSNSSGSSDDSTDSGSNNNNNTSNSNSNSTTTQTTTNFTSTLANDAVVNNHNKNRNLIENTNNNNINNNNKLINDNYKNKRIKRYSVRNSNNSGSNFNDSTTASTATPTLKDVVEGYKNNNSNNNNNKRSYATLSKRKLNDDGRCIRKQQKQEHQREVHLKLQHQQQQQQPQQELEEQQLTEQTPQQQQSNNFISTANSEDPCPEDPVISKLLKRSKRKAEFRKRRRIRPCLNVCQTVEQKCPYLLPADRAPALPTQYAGEPTFLCLDQNIPETGEQLRRSSYGPAECCYSYCYGDPRQGICTYCNAFAEAPAAAAEDFAGSATTNATATRRVHNFTLTATTSQTKKNQLQQHQQQQQQKQRLGAVVANETRSASVAIALKNTTTTASANAEEERLPFYAYFEGIYYYDDDTQDMPAVATSGDCPVVPSVTSRCTIPYYSSSYSSAAAPAWAAPPPKTLSALIGQQLLMWLSAMLCLLSSYHAAAAAATGATMQRQRQRGVREPTPTADVVSVSRECRRCVSRSREMVAKSVVVVVGSEETTMKLYTNATRRGTQATATATTAVVCGSVIHCSRRRGSISQSNRKRSHVSRGASSRNCSSRNKIKIKFNKRKPVQKQINIYKLSKVHFSSNIKFYRSKNSSKFSTCTSNIITITSNNYANNNNNNNNKINRKTNNYNNTNNINNTNNTTNNNNNHNNDYNSCLNHNNNRNYRFFYYYNFNINDWWRRWWWIRVQGGAALLS